MRAQAREWITSWFRNRGKLGKVTADELLHRNYLETGMLTSMEIVELITEIENEFGIQFSESDLQDPRLVTVFGLSELIAERSAEKSGSGAQPATAGQGERL